MSIRTLLPAQAEPLYLDEVKDHCRISEPTLENAWVTRSIRTAREHVETYTRRALVRRVVEITLDGFPCEPCEPILLPVTPLRQVTQVAYLDTAGASQTMSLADLRINTRSEPPLIMPAYGKVWPWTLPTAGAVTITAEVGHVAPITAVDTSGDTLAIAGHCALEAGAVYFSNSGGALPAPLQVFGHYYAKNISAAGFQVAATAGGAAIDLTDGGTGLHFLGEIPNEIVHAMLMLIDHWHEHRGAITFERQPFEVPTGVDALLWPQRVQVFG